MEGDEGKVTKKNVGPSITFKLRDATGQAIEYQNYMNPVSIKGQYYYISGVRTSPGEPFRYLHIPLDPKGSKDRFFKFLTNMQNNELVKTAAIATTRNSMQQNSLQNAEMENQVIESMVRLTEQFSSKGSEGIMQEIAARFPEEKRENASEAFMKVLNASLRSVYLETLKQEGSQGEPSEADWLFFDDSILAVDKIAAYGSPWLVQLSSFKQIEASGLQITRSPGKDVVYFGSAMLVLGVFLLFYISHRRIWIWIKPQGDNQSDLVMAGSSNRNQPEFERYFNHLQGIFQQVMAHEVKHVSSTTND
jgi:cytochrome c biogenesis protein